MNRVLTVVLDNEAVQSLLNSAHAKHRQALASIEEAVDRQRRRSGSVRLVVPAAVRVEAGWDRRAPGAARINRLRVEDAALDRPAADRAAAVRRALGVSVADAHLAAVVGTSAPVTVVTSDVENLRRIAAHLDVVVTIVAL